MSGCVISRWLGYRQPPGNPKIVTRPSAPGQSQEGSPSGSEDSCLLLQKTVRAGSFLDHLITFSFFFLDRFLDHLRRCGHRLPRSRSRGALPGVLTRLGHISGLLGLSCKPPYVHLSLPCLAFGMVYGYHGTETQGQKAVMAVTRCRELTSSKDPSWTPPSLDHVVGGWST